MMNKFFKRVRQWIEANPSLSFGLVTVLCTFLLFIFHAQMADISTLGKEDFMDSLMVSLPFFFVPRKWRKAILYLFPLLIILFEVNVLYARNFSALPGLGAALSPSSYNSYTFRGAVDSFEFLDLLKFGSVYAVLLLAWCKLGGRTVLTARSFRKSIVLTSAILWILMPFVRFTFTTFDIYKRHNVAAYKSFGAFYASSGRGVLSNGPQKCLELYGVVPYVYSAIATAFPRTVELTEQDRMDITEFLKNQAHEHLVLQNRGKNLILIVVESLNSTVLDTDATPFLNELAHREDALTAYNLLSQVGPGRSSDGQFMFNTGLLPLKQEAFVEHFAQCDYPSLAKSLPVHSSVEMICENSKLWNHKLTSSSYGFKQLIDKLSPHGLDQDSIFLNAVSDKLLSTSVPCFVFATTISMHDPYNEPRTSQLLPGYSANDRTGVYLSAARHFDNALRRFMDDLQMIGLSDSTVVAIVGDHSAQSKGFSPELVCNTVPLIIVNAGVGKQIYEQASQIDVFPTLLDVMGVSQAYRGVGCSLLSDTILPTPDEAWRISELIIRSQEGIALLPKNE